MAHKVFRWLFGKEDEKEEVKPLIPGRRTKRIGMDKNFRVGKVIYVHKKRHERTYILVDIIEMCNSDDDRNEIYPCSYNLWIHIPDKWISSVSNDLLGQYVVVGFYMQSFRNKDEPGCTTVLSCRFLNRLDSEQTARALAIDLMDSRQFVEHPSLKLSNIKLNNQ